MQKGEPTGFVIGTEKQGLVQISTGSDGGIRKSSVLFIPRWPPSHRFNDGKVDPVGRFVAGTMGTVGLLARSLIECL